MSCSVEYDEGLGIVIITYQGECTGQDFREASRTRIELAEQRNTTKTLIDATALECGLSTTFDVFNIVDREYPREGNPSEWRIAITTPESTTAREQVRFYENVCVNRGWNVKEFAERKEAIEWLIKVPPQERP